MENLTCLEAPSPRGFYRLGIVRLRRGGSFTKTQWNDTFQSGAGCPRGEHFQRSSHQGSQIKSALEGHKWLYSVVHKFPNSILVAWKNGSRKPLKWQRRSKQTKQVLGKAEAKEEGDSSSPRMLVQWRKTGHSIHKSTKKATLKHKHSRELVRLKGDVKPHQVRG